MKNKKLSKAQQEVVDYLAKDKGNYIIESPYYSYQKVYSPAEGRVIHHFTEATLNSLRSRFIVDRDPYHTTRLVLHERAKYLICQMLITDLCTAGESKIVDHVLKNFGVSRLVDIKTEDIPELLSNLKAAYTAVMY